MDVGRQYPNWLTLLRPGVTNCPALLRHFFGHRTCSARSGIVIGGVVHAGFFSFPQTGPARSCLRAFACAVTSVWNTLSTTPSIQKGLLGAHLMYEPLF